MDDVSVWQLKSIKNDSGNLQNRFFVCNAFYCVYNNYIVFTSSPQDTICVCGILL